MNTYAKDQFGNINLINPKNRNLLYLDGESLRDFEGDSFPKSLSQNDFRALTVLDTFDQYSPEHDHPQRLKKVCKMFERNGAEIAFSGRVFYGDGGDAVVVRGIRRE